MFRTSLLTKSHRPEVLRLCCVQSFSCLRQDKDRNGADFVSGSPSTLRTRPFVMPKVLLVYIPKAERLKFVRSGSSIGKSHKDYFVVRVYLFQNSG
jgi:hypothetical protein